MSDTQQGPDWWLASDGRWYPPMDPTAQAIAPSPPPSAPVPVPQPFLLTIGDIGITADAVVTPNGSGPLAGTQWIVTDRSITTTRIPPWAIVMAILFALACLLGLLFLLVKETVTQGYVEVSVRTGNVVHVTQLPVSNAADVNRWRQLVHQAQSLTAQAR